MRIATLAAMLASFGRKKGEPAVDPRQFLYDYESRKDKGTGRDRKGEIRDPEQMKALLVGMAGGKNIQTFPKGRLMTRERERREREGK